MVQINFKYGIIQAKKRLEKQNLCSDHVFFYLKRQAEKS